MFIYMRAHDFWLNKSIYLSKYGSYKKAILIYIDMFIIHIVRITIIKIFTLFIFISFFFIFIFIQHSSRAKKLENYITLTIPTINSVNQSTCYFIFSFFNIIIYLIKNNFVFSIIDKKQTNYVLCFENSI